MLAADRVMPWVTTAGMVTPIGPSPIWSAKLSTISPTTAATFLGVDFSGVAILSRSVISSPVARSTGAPLMPLPPISMPRTGLLHAVSSVMIGSLATSLVIRGGRGGLAHWGHDGRSKVAAVQPDRARLRGRHLRAAGHAGPARGDRRLGHGQGTTTPYAAAAVAGRPVRHAHADRRPRTRSSTRWSSSRRAGGSPGGTSPGTSGATCWSRGSEGHPGDRAVRPERSRWPRLTGAAGLAGRATSRRSSRRCTAWWSGPRAARSDAPARLRPGRRSSPGTDVDVEQCGDQQDHLLVLRGDPAPVRAAGPAESRSRCGPGASR